MNDPYRIIKAQYITEKSQVLTQLQHANNNPCVAKCDRPKYVFLVEKSANKIEIKKAIEKIYEEKKVRVRSVNTLHVKCKKRRVRGRAGYKPAFKKAIVTLEPGDVIGEEV